MLLTLLFENQPIGEVEFAGDQGAERHGLLRPAPGYAGARSALQMLTVGAFADAEGSPERLSRSVSSATQALARRGLELRDKTGATARTSRIMVADYFPADCDPAMFEGIRLPVIARFT